MYKYIYGKWNHIHGTHSVNMSPSVEIMASRLISAKPLSDPMLDHCSLDHTEFQWNFNWNFNVAIQGNVFKNGRHKMAVISCRPQCVNAIQIWRIYKIKCFDTFNLTLAANLTSTSDFINHSYRAAIHLWCISRLKRPRGLDSGFERTTYTKSRLLRIRWKQSINFLTNLKHRDLGISAYTLSVYVHE